MQESDHHVLIIAEAGVNHNGSLELAKKLIDAASNAGADFVKFQTFNTDYLVSKAAEKATYQKQNLKDTDQGQYAMLKRLELSQDAHHLLINYCKEKNIAFLSTGFDPTSLEFLNDLDLPLFKIPSGEITNLPYLKQIAGFGKPVVMSTGMATLGEIEAALRVLTEGGIAKSDITVLHCTTEYPAPLEEVNLRAMLTIGQQFGVSVGYSDHTKGLVVPVAATALGACVIEKHFTLDRSMEGPDHQASIEPAELKQMVQEIRAVQLALGDPKKQPSTSERANIKVARKSIHLKQDLEEGQVVKESDLVMLRPGDGITPMQLPEVVGKTTTRGLKAFHKLSWQDLS